MRQSFFRQWKAEQKKAKKRYIWALPVGFLAFQILWILWTIHEAKPGEIDTGYLMLFYDLPILNTILLPIMIAVIASRLCDMEIKVGTLKMLYTLQNRGAFFDCKYLSGLKYLFFFILGQGSALLLAGRIFHFGRPLKPSMLFWYLISTLLVSAAILCIQQTLSLLSNNQILPLIVGLAGSFLGLFSLFFPAAITKLVLWGYYAVFTSVGMNWDSSTRFTEYYESPFPVTTFFIFLIFTVLIYIVCRTILTQKEV